VDASITVPKEGVDASRSSSSANAPIPGPSSAPGVAGRKTALDEDLLIDALREGSFAKTFGISSAHLHVAQPVYAAFMNQHKQAGTKVFGGLHEHTKNLKYCLSYISKTHPDVCTQPVLLFWDNCAVLSNDFFIMTPEYLVSRMVEDLQRSFGRKVHRRHCHRLPQRLAVGFGDRPHGNSENQIHPPVDGSGKALHDVSPALSG